MLWNFFKTNCYCKFNHHRSYLKPFLSYLPCIVHREYLSIIFNVKKCALYLIKYSTNEYYFIVQGPGFERLALGGKRSSLFVSDDEKKFYNVVRRLFGDADAHWHLRQVLERGTETKPFHSGQSTETGLSQPVLLISTVYLFGAERPNPNETHSPLRLVMTEASNRMWCDFMATICTV
jgi:hypothetical protein